MVEEDRLADGPMRHWAMGIGHWRELDSIAY